MYYRRKVLLGLIQFFGRSLTNTDLQKLLFLLSESQEKKSYEFVPYKFGCFSFQSIVDKSALEKYGHLQKGEIWTLINTQTDYLKLLKDSDLDLIRELFKEYSKKKGKKLVMDVYLKYPYYAINSEIAPKILDDEQLKLIQRKKPSGSTPMFYTIGYEGITLENYLNKLIKNNVRVLCDIRKNPISKKFGFSKNQLKNACAKVGINYMHIPELGIEASLRREITTEGDIQRLFSLYEKTTLKDERNKLLLLKELVQNHNRVAITCFEAHHQNCHRGRVTKEIKNIPDWNYEITHL